MRIITLLLVNGDEIIGRCIEENSITVTIEKPVRMAVNQKGLGFSPLCVSIDDASEITFKQQHVLFVVPTRKEIEEYYIKATTGIQLASLI